MEINEPSNQAPLGVKPPKPSLQQRWQKKWKKTQAYFRMAGRFTPLLRKRKKRIITSLIFAVGYIAMGVAQPWPIKMIFDDVLLHKHKTAPILNSVLAPWFNQPLQLLNILIVLIIAIALVRGIFYYFYQLLVSKIGQQIAADIRVDLYSHLQGLSFSFHDRRRTGDLIMRLTNDIRVLRDILISLPITILSEFFLILGMIIVMFMMDWKLTLIALTILPILALLLRKYQKPMKHAARKQRERDGRLATIATETLGAIRVVQSFRREDYELERFSTQNDSSLRQGLRATRLEAKFRWAADLAVAVITATVLWFAAHRVLSGRLSPGDVIVFITYMQAFSRPLRRISTMAERSARGTAAGDRILEMLRTQPKVYDLPGAVACGRLQGNIGFEKVSFYYGKTQKSVLSNIDLKIRAGERVAIIGKTGAGKSTLVSLLPRFYDPTEGRVLLDNRDAKDFTLASLRENISLVFQEPVLFATSIAENIAYGKPDATRDQIIKAAKLAGLDSIIDSLPDGYDTILGERGGTLSGGQRQCVSIARAIIKDAPIAILDEPTSGLDHQSAAFVMQALHRLMMNRTVLIISHQLDMLRQATRIIVISQGQIIEDGVPSKVAALRKYQQDLYRLQPEESLP